MNLGSIITAVATSVALVSFAPPASAVSWYSSSSPLYVSEGGVRQGQAFGVFYDKNSSWAESASYQYDLRPGGNAVRVETDYWWYGQHYSACGSQGGQCWWHDVSRQSMETDTASWRWHTVGRGLRASASKARGTINICEVQRWSNDPCSPLTHPTFDY